MAKQLKTLDEVTIRFAGDSGDGMQLTGTQFTNTVAALGADLSTLPDYPAEIRAPAGTKYGVSGFQIKFGSTDIHTPGDHVRRAGGHEPRCTHHQPETPPGGRDDDRQRGCLQRQRT